MGAGKLALSDGHWMRLVYADETPYGSAVSGRCDDVIRARCDAIVRRRGEGGLAAVVEQGPELLAEAMRSGGLGELYESPRALRRACLFPAPEAVRPVRLAVGAGGSDRGMGIPLPAALVPELACWLDDWTRGSAAPASGPARQLWDHLAAAGALTEADERPVFAEPATLVGHATVQIVAGGRRLLFDPFLSPRAPQYPADYQPITHRQLAPDAIFVTHSHPDHFDLASLLRLGAQVPIYVPAVAAESLLCLDMAARLREVGFVHVHTLGWGDSVRVGAAEVTALPFYGEQPTRAERLHPEVRNMGNVYLVEGDGRRYGVAADIGVDAAGDPQALAAQTAARRGPLDVLFGGYRSWTIDPVRYLFSSVARYVLFVPPEQWRVRQQIMNGIDDLLDLAEAWGASHVVPYADGGAPWYWERGLGPRLDGAGRCDPDFDPSPVEVTAAARRRQADGRGGRRPRVWLLRPGESLSWTAGAPALSRAPGHRWPYGDEQ